jgi:chitinase
MQKLTPIFFTVVENIIPDVYTTDGKCHSNIFCGSWAGGSCCYNGQCGSMCDASAGCTSGCDGPPASDPTTDDDNNNDGDDDDNYGPEDYVGCDYSKTFANLDDLNAASDGMRLECLAAYAMETLITMLDAAYDNYTSVNDGYDKEFGFYVTYIQNLVPDVLAKSFMFDRASQTNRMAIPPLGPGMKCEYCTILTVADMPGTDNIHQPDFTCQVDEKNSKPFPCTDISPNSDIAARHMSKHTTAMTLNDENGYNIALGDAGISPDWVTLGSQEINKDYTVPGAGRAYKYVFSGFPIKNPDMSVPNPKDLVTKGLGNIPELRRSMQATYLEIVLGLYVGGSTMDAVEAYSTPVFMLMQAVDSMAQAKALGIKEEDIEEKEEERRKNFILLIVSVVLMVCDAVFLNHP